MPPQAPLNAPESNSLNSLSLHPLWESCGSGLPLYAEWEYLKGMALQNCRLCNESCKTASDTSHRTPHMSLRLLPQPQNTPQEGNTPLLKELPPSA